MDLRGIRKEVDSLHHIEENLNKFQNNWIKPIKKNSNKHLPFMKNLNQDSKKELHNKILNLKSTFEEIKSSQIINDDQHKSKIITNQLLNDDFMNFKNTLTQIKALEGNVEHLQQQYHEVNDLLHKHLSLEEAVFFMEIPHLKYLHNLLQITKNHKVISRNIGTNMIALIKETQFKKHKRR